MSANNPKEGDNCSGVLLRFCVLGGGGWMGCLTCLNDIHFCLTDDDDTPIMSLLRQQAATVQAKAAPVSAILLKDLPPEPASVPAKKMRKKRVKRVNWVYVVANSSDITHVSDFTIAATAESPLALGSGVEAPVAETCDAVPSLGKRRRNPPVRETSVDVLVDTHDDLLIEAPDDHMGQKFGLSAIGEFVCRDFGPDGIFYGKITAYRLDNDKKGLYSVTYSDNDVEDLDEEEYNYAYSLWLQDEGWESVEADALQADGKAKKIYGNASFRTTGANKRA
jgi:hypothetical protein